MIKRQVWYYVDQEIRRKGLLFNVIAILIVGSSLLDMNNIMAPTIECLGRQGEPDREMMCLWRISLKIDIGGMRLLARARFLTNLCSESEILSSHDDFYAKFLVEESFLAQC